jgi:hypothetical protein
MFSSTCDAINDLAFPNKFSFSPEDELHKQQTLTHINDTNTNNIAKLSITNLI